MGEWCPGSAILVGLRLLQPVGDVQSAPAADFFLFQLLLNPNMPQVFDCCFFHFGDKSHKILFLVPKCSGGADRVAWNILIYCVEVTAVHILLI